jgi:hypothetical protein
MHLVWNRKNRSYIVLLIFYFLNLFYHYYYDEEPLKAGLDHNGTPCLFFLLAHSLECIGLRSKRSRDIPNERSRLSRINLYFLKVSIVGRSGHPIWPTIVKGWFDQPLEEWPIIVLLWLVTQNRGGVITP